MIDERHYVPPEWQGKTYSARQIVALIVWLVRLDDRSAQLGHGGFSSGEGSVVREICLARNERRHATVSTVALAFGHTRATTRRYLNRMKSDGKITMERIGRDTVLQMTPKRQREMIANAETLIDALAQARAEILAQ
jgi:hypothetical protein